jgi:hypothetical protein
MEVSGQLRDTAALNPGKGTVIPIQLASWAAEPVLTMWAGEKSADPTWNLTPTAQAMACCCTY